MERITSRQNALCMRIRRLSRARAARREAGEFLIEGPKLLGEAVRWGAEIRTVLATPKGLEGLPPLPGVRLAEVPEDLLKSLSDTESPQGVLALCALPPTAPPEHLPAGRWLVLDGVQDPGNVGTIWRTADAFGAAGLMLVNHCADPFSPKTVRATMGACFRLPVWETQLDALKPLLDAAGVPLYATALREDTRDVRSADLSAAAVIIGSEGRGVSKQALELCKQTLKIPMTDRCESLNAAVAAGVVLWEMFR